MEQETARPYNQIPQEGNGEDLVMSISATADDALDTQPHEQEVCQGIDNLCGINGRIVVLKTKEFRLVLILQVENIGSRQLPAHIRCNRGGDRRQISK